ncbi:MAG TPA: hypothetical protein VJ385_20010 [Fibrobacteria bacterium]|nr:hypothetical protein [Fibrobacteria bacterium]
MGIQPIFRICVALGLTLESAPAFKGTELVKEISPSTKASEIQQGEGTEVFTGAKYAAIVDNSDRLHPSVQLLDENLTEKTKIVLEEGFIVSVSIAANGLFVINQQDYSMEFRKQAFFYNATGKLLKKYPYFGGPFVLSPDGRYALISESIPGEGNDFVIFETKRWKEKKSDIEPGFGFFSARFRRDGKILFIRQDETKDQNKWSTKLQILDLDAAVSSKGIRNPIKSVPLAYDDGLPLTIDPSRLMLQSSDDGDLFTCALKDEGSVYYPSRIVIFDKDLNKVTQRKYAEQISQVQLVSSRHMLVSSIESPAKTGEATRFTMAVLEPKEFKELRKDPIGTGWFHGAIEYGDEVYFETKNAEDGRIGLYRFSSGKDKPVFEKTGEKPMAKFHGYVFAKEAGVDDSARNGRFLRPRSKEILKVYRTHIGGKE